MQVFQPKWLIVTAQNVAVSYLDMDTQSTYYVLMKVRSILLFAFLTLFAVSNIAHAMNADSMVFQMAMSDGNMMAMDGCQYCPKASEGSAETPLCNLDCTASAVYDLTKNVRFNITVFEFGQERPLAVMVPDWLPVPPDPHPPRFLI